ncbi:MAG: tRNA 2-thiouridine(34) synthase MnmA [Patescibacteria group bacterium]|nr:tRNA 2-thiouridine(34) synthase MnmA [Patescibacteria group bacterium]
MQKHVICAMSGGVDSSVAAALLKKQGFKVTGVFMRFWHEQNNKTCATNRCCSQDSFDSARQVCQKLGIRLYSLNCEKEFKNHVVDYFLDYSKKGLTPNPCIACNKHIKFGFLIKKLQELNADYLATGHYAQVKSQKSKVKSDKEKVKKTYKLLRSKDKNKDQSYFLYNLNQKKLARILFPIGNYTKPEVRELAKNFGLPTASKEESQEICFIQEKNYHNFLKRNLKKIKPGKIKTVSGKTIGEHQGLCFYTIGQRKGIGLGLEKTFYVAKLDFKHNILYVTDNPDDKQLFSKIIKLKNLNLIGERLTLPYSCQIKIRSHASPVSGKIIKINKNQAIISLLSSVRAVMPGQSAVIYKREILIGGGVIAKAE